MKKFTDKYMLPNLLKIITTIGKLLPRIGGTDGGCGRRMWRNCGGGSSISTT